MRAGTVDDRTAFGCPLEMAHRLLRPRWTLAVALALLDGPLCFGGIRSRIPGLSANVLAQRLRHLASEGIVAGGGGRLAPYRLTSWGGELSVVFGRIEEWRRAAAFSQDQ